MSLIGDATGAGEIASAVSSIAGKIMDAIFPDPTKKAEAEQAGVRSQIELMMAPLQGQIDTNKIEAASASVFVSGWRPAVGWVCTGALAWNYVLGPMVTYLLVVGGIQAPPLPVIDGTMAQLLFGILGLNIGARTYERVQGVARGQSPTTPAVR